MNESVRFSVCPHGDLVTARLSQDLDLITGKLRQAFDAKLTALVLVGGFGRGEGGVLFENGQVKPVNDYDLVMVLNTSCDVSCLAEIRTELAQALGIWWVDISSYTIAQLKKLPYTMYHYDLKYGSRVIEGDPGVLSLIPDMDPARMPLTEAEIQFYVRLWCFLGPFSTRFLEQPPGDDDKFLLANQFSKALLACSDALLILNALYHHSYAERFDRFKAAFPTCELLPWVEEATEFKLNPTRDIRYDVVERWFEVRRLYLDTMRYFVGRMHKREFRDWPDYAGYYRNNPARILRRLAYLIVKRSLRREKSIQVNLAQLFLLAAFEKASVDDNLFGLAKQELGKITRTDQSGLDWEAARAMIAQIRLDL